MKTLINKFNKLRNLLITDKRYYGYLDFKYWNRTQFGLMRGIFSSLAGRVRYEGDYRPFILGNNIDFHMESGSSIILRGDNKISEESYPINKVHPSATSIGTHSHWNYMNPPMGRPTRIRLRKNAKLIMNTNTSILTGSYIAVWPDQKLEISENVSIAQGVFINTRCGLSIGRNVLIAHEASIMDYDGHPIFSAASNDDVSIDDTYGGMAQPIVIEDDVWIGFKAIILKGCTIGAGSIIGAGACVTSDVPPNSIVVGNPARVIKQGISWRKY